MARVVAALKSQGRARSKAPGAEDADRRLIEAAQKDRGRFAELYEIHFDRIYAYVARRMGERAAAEDVTSEVFHHALKNIARFEWRGVPFAAWLYRIAANEIADHANRTTRARDAVESINEGGGLNDPNEKQIEIADKRARLYPMVRKLPAEQRQVIAMRFGEQRTISEIALAIGRSEGAVKQLQFRALGNLRAQMDEK